MKCPIDKTEMEKGIIPDKATYVTTILRWAKSVNIILGAKETQNIIAYRCPKCGKVELTTEVK